MARYTGPGLNSGVLVMHLGRMRDRGLQEVMTQELEQRRAYGEPVTLGDQDIFNTVLSRFPYSVRWLPCSFNYRPDYCMFQFDDCRRCGDSPPGILHGSRQAFVPNSDDASTFPSMAIVFDAFDRTRTTVLSSAKPSVSSLVAAMESHGRELLQRWSNLTETAHSGLGVSPCSGEAGTWIIEAASGAMARSVSGLRRSSLNNLTQLPTKIK